MTADILSLSKHRKAKAKAAHERAAAENRIAFGRTKAEKLKAKAEAQGAAGKLDAHRLDKPEPRG